MSNPLHEPVLWESPEELVVVGQFIESLNLRERLRGKARERPNETFTAKTTIGVFHVCYHSFEGALEVINETRTFRLVYWRQLVRIDGDKTALKRWLLPLKLSE